MCWRVEGIGWVEVHYTEMEVREDGCHVVSGTQSGGRVLWTSIAPGTVLTLEPVGGVTTNLGTESSWETMGTGGSVSPRLIGWGDPRPPVTKPARLVSRGPSQVWHRYRSVRGQGSWTPELVLVSSRSFLTTSPYPPSPRSKSNYQLSINTPNPPSPTSFHSVFRRDDGGLVYLPLFPTTMVQSSSDSSPVSVRSGSLKHRTTRSSWS